MEDGNKTYQLDVCGFVRRGWGIYAGSVDATYDTQCVRVVESFGCNRVRWSVSLSSRGSCMASS